MLPELQIGSAPEANALSREFSSADTVLDLAGTVRLLQAHKLMVGDADLSQGVELLR